MLGILITILKIIGIVLLSILGLLLAVIFIVLFVPVRYKAKGDYPPGKISLKASFLLHLVSFKLEYNDGFNYCLKILGLSFIDNKRNKSKKTNKKNKNKDAVTLNGTNNTKEKSVDISEIEDISNENIINEDITQKNSSKEALDHKNDEASKAFSEDEKSKATEDKTGIFETLTDIRDNLEYYKNLLEKPSTQAAISLCKDRIGKLLKSILPRRGRVNLKIGLENAGITGKIMGAYYALYSYIGHVVHIIPYYDEQIIEGDFYLSGHIRVITMLYHLIRIYFDKNCHRLIKIFIKKAKAGKGK